MIDPFSQDVLWIVVVGFIVAFLLAFGIGANDVANSFGTSVGAKVLSFRQACIVAGIFELAGAILIGTRVSDTVRKGIIDVGGFNGAEALAMLGALSALSGASVWLFIATFFRLPVSGTHSIVGATMGYALVQHGIDGVHWKKFGMIAVSWVVSPILSGIASSIVFMVIRYAIIRKKDAFKAGLKSLPFFYAFAVSIILFSIFYKGSHLLRFNTIPLYGVLILSFGGAIMFAILIHFVVAPWLKKKILKEVSEKCELSKQSKEQNDHQVFLQENNWNTSEAGDKKETIVYLNDSGISIESTIKLLEDSPDSSKFQMNGKAHDFNNGSPELHNEKNGKEETESCLLEEVKTCTELNLLTAREKITDEPKIGKLFSFLQILTASFGAFAHGGNDVSNAIAPTITLWIIYTTGAVASKAQTPIWILCFGGVGIVIGLCIWGRRVIKTLGEDLTPITPSSGFSIEIGSALTVLVASNLGIPVSTTHCKVGSVVMVGRVRSKSVVDWKLFKNIIISWIVTMPCAGGFSAAVYAILRQVV